MRKAPSVTYPHWERDKDNTTAAYLSKLLLIHARHITEKVRQKDSGIQCQLTFFIHPQGKLLDWLKSYNVLQTVKYQESSYNCLSCGIKGKSNLVCYWNFFQISDHLEKQICKLGRLANISDILFLDHLLNDQLRLGHHLQDQDGRRPSSSSSSASWGGSAGRVCLEQEGWGGSWDGEKLLFSSLSHTTTYSIIHLDCSNKTT